MTGVGMESLEDQSNSIMGLSDEFILKLANRLLE